MTYSGQTPTDDYLPPDQPRGCANTAKRVLGCGCGVVLLILIALAATDGLLAARYGDQVQQKLRQLRAAGKPLTGTELAPPPVPDAENAAPLYLKAADIVEPHDGQPAGGSAPGSTSASRVVGYSEADWDSPTEMATLARLVREDRAAMDLARQATARPKCRFDVQWQSLSTAIFPHGRKVRLLTRFESAAAAVASHQGNQAEALDRLRMGFVASRRASEDPVLTMLLLANAMDAALLKSAEYALSHGPVPEGPARRLADELGRADYRRAFVRARQSQRIEDLETFDSLAAGGQAASAFVGTGANVFPDDLLFWCYGSPIAPALRPLLRKDELLYLSLAARQECIAGKPWPQAATAARQWVADVDCAPAWAAVTRLSAYPSYQAQTRVESTAAWRELLQIALGLHVYRQKHDPYPDSLDALRSLSWPVPLDRFSGKPLIYRRQSDRFLLYSIGPDMKDDGGKPIWYLYHDRQKHPSPKQGNTDAGDLVWMDWSQG